MTTRVRLAGVAVLLLTCLSVRSSLADQPDSVLAARAGALPGRGAVGAQLGGLWFLTQKDYSEGAQPRFSFSGQYSYVISPHWRWQISPYFGWNAYRTGTRIPFQDENFPTDTTKDAVLTQMAGGNAQIQWQRARGRSVWHLGAGPTLYRVVVQNHRKVLKDPVSKDLHQGQYLGATAEVGYERFLKDLTSTSLEWTLAYQSSFAERDAQFPSGFNSSLSGVEIRFGAHYYFDFKKAKKPDELPAKKKK